MLVAIQWSPRGDMSEEDQKRGMARFAKWEPPAGVEFQGFYDYADGNGGIAIAEASSAEALLEAVAPWSNGMRFTIRAIVPSEKSMPIMQKAIEWRDSVS